MIKKKYLINLEYADIKMDLQLKEQVKEETIAIYCVVKDFKYTRGEAILSAMAITYFSNFVKTGSVILDSFLRLFDFFELKLLLYMLLVDPHNMVFFRLLEDWKTVKEPVEKESVY